MLGKFSGACRHISSLDREYTLWQDASRSFCVSRVSEYYSGIDLTGISSIARIEYRGAGRVVSTPGRCSRNRVGVRKNRSAQETAFILVAMGCRMINAFRKWILAVCLALLVSQGLLAQSDLGKISGFRSEERRVGKVLMHRGVGCE